MEKPVGTGFMAVFAVSGSVVFLAVQIHKRLLSNFLKKMEFEIKNSTAGAGKGEATMKKKRVRFAVEERESSGGKRNTVRACGSGSGSGRGSRNKKIIVEEETLAGMPQNWQAMYRGILQCRNHRAYY